MSNTIVFPRGAGGNWLSNLIHRLETDNHDIPVVEYMFDGEQRSETIPFRHWYDVVDNKTIWFVDPAASPIVFSTECTFNLYLNVIIKTQLNPRFDTNILQDSERDQFFKFVDIARYMLTDINYSKCYYQNIRLNFKLIFTDPNAFVDQLFDVLDEAKIKYYANRNYCLASIANYRSTCANPTTYINGNNIIWRAWIAGIAESLSLNINGDIFDPDTLLIHKDQLMQKHQQLFFNWS